MRILVDTREQNPFTFAGYEAATAPATLPVGDYSLPGFTDRAAIERKSLNDLIGCLMGKDRQRFERELRKGRAYDLLCVVVEASLSDVSQGSYRSEMKPHAALQSIITFQVRYRTPFVWAGNRAGAEYVTFSMLQKYLREIEERFRQASKAQKEKAGRKHKPRKNQCHNDVGAVV